MSRETCGLRRVEFGGTGVRVYGGSLVREEDFVVGDGGLAQLVVDDLSWAVQGIGVERQADSALQWFAVWQRTAEQGDVAFLDSVLGELPLQVAVGLAVLCDDQQAAGVEVEAVDEQ